MSCGNPKRFPLVSWRGPKETLAGPRTYRTTGIFKLSEAPIFHDPWKLPVKPFGSLGNRFTTLGLYQKTKIDSARPLLPAAREKCAEEWERIYSY
jgi:hypothetical protein